MRPFVTGIVAGIVLAICLACTTPTSTGSLAPPPRPSESDVAVEVAARRRGSITERFDEFRRIGILRAQWVLGAMQLDALRSSTDPSAALLSFSRTSSEWRYLRCHDVDALVDGTPMPLPRFSRDGEVGHGMVFERVSAEVPIETLRAMAQASVVRMRVCSDEVRLEGEQLRTLRDFLARQPPTAPPTETSATSAPASVAMLPCGIPSGYVRICVSSRGYRFALPYAEPCPSGSTAAGAVQLTCDALQHPAYHACLSETGAWSSVHAWVACRERGLLNAAGDFVPPGRTPEQGIAPAPTSPDR